MKQYLNMNLLHDWCIDEALKLVRPDKAALEGLIKTSHKLFIKLSVFEVLLWLLSTFRAMPKRKSNRRLNMYVILRNIQLCERAIRLGDDPKIPKARSCGTIKNASINALMISILYLFHHVRNDQHNLRENDH